MARDSLPSGQATLYQLQQPEKLHNVLEQDNPEDCLLCRLTGAQCIPIRASLFTVANYQLGAAAFIGLGGYSYLSGQNQLQMQKATIQKSGSRFGMKSRQAGLTGIAMTFVGMGLWRLIN